MMVIIAKKTVDGVSVRPTGSTRMVYLGHYSTAIEAAEVYDAYCSIHCTDKQLNFNKDKVDE